MFIKVIPSSILFLCISQFIYQEYYKVSSAAEKGTLSQLRNVIHRIDVSGGDGALDKFREWVNALEWLGIFLIIVKTIALIFICKKKMYIVRLLPLSSDLTNCFRAHNACVIDCLDAYIPGNYATGTLWWSANRMETTPLLMTLGKSDQYQRSLKLGQEILENHVKLDKGITNLNCKRIDSLTSILSYVFVRYLSPN